LPAGRTGEALGAWIAASDGVELEGVYLGDGGAMEGRGVGVFAARGGLDEGEAYVSVPWRLVMGTHSLEHSPELAAVMRQLRAEFGADDKSVLLLILLHERFVSHHDSPWRDYLMARPPVKIVCSS
jgi:hypothetical protein